MRAKPATDAMKGERRVSIRGEHDVSDYVKFREQF